MTKKLYYSVDLDVERTGTKLITVYAIENNEPKKLFELDLDYDDDSLQGIQEHLDENGYGYTDVAFVIL